MSVSLKNVSLKNVQIAEVAFISAWKTDNVGTSNDDQITVPTVSTGSYNCVVDWGDGSSDTITTWDDAAWTHTYPAIGTYTVKITGEFTGIQFNNGVDREKLLTISRWGQFTFNGAQSFYGCNNLSITATDIPKIISLATLHSTFRNCTNNLTTIPDLTNWNIANASAISSFFHSAYNFIGDPSGWDVSKITTFGQMFRGAFDFNGDISSWDVSRAINMGQFFQGAQSFNQDIGGWNTSAVTAMGTMFRDCDIFNQDIGGWDVSKVTIMSAMFKDAIAFDQDLSSWDITSLLDATEMFLNVTLSTANYDAFLISAAAQAVKPNVPFHGGNSKYSAGAATTARGVLTGGLNNWTITDGGPV